LRVFFFAERERNQKKSENVFLLRKRKTQKKKGPKSKKGSHPPVDSARERPWSLREDPVDDAVGQAVVAVAEEVLLRQQEVVVGVELLF